jgi:hypothetical protein
MKQHKWHKEIKAWADGAEIERRTRNTNGTWSEWENLIIEEWYVQEWYEYRIKPQPKEPQDVSSTSYLYAYVKLGRTQVEFHRGYKAGNIPDLHGIEYLGKIKLED